MRFKCERAHADRRHLSRMLNVEPERVYRDTAVAGSFHAGVEIRNRTRNQVTLSLKTAGKPVPVQNPIDMNPANLLAGARYKIRE